VFLRKLEDMLWNGIHLLVVDLFRPTPRDPGGFPSAFWGDHGEGRIPESTEDAPFTLTACRAISHPTVYVELVGIGSVLPAMPLFLTPDHYVNVPLEETYAAAWEGVPHEWKQRVGAFE
jgi:hypothetical protein